MGFWGVKINQKKPCTLSHRNSGDSLKITQATLNFLNSRENTREKRNVIVFCKIGDREPIPICTLVPNKVESCSLRLNFVEEENVVLSVVGNQIVHLTGFYKGCRPYRDSEDDKINSSDTSGKGAKETESEESSDYLSEDDSESSDSFMNSGNPVRMTSTETGKEATAKFPLRLTPTFPLGKKKRRNSIQKNDFYVNVRKN